MELGRHAVCKREELNRFLNTLQLLNCKISLKNKTREIFNFVLFKSSLLPSVSGPWGGENPNQKVGMNWSPKSLKETNLGVARALF